MKSTSIIALIALPLVQGFSSSFVARSNKPAFQSKSSQLTQTQRSKSSSTTLSMIDQNVIMGGAIGVLSFGAGIALVAFTESAGTQGGGVSEEMSTRIAGSLMEDVEVSSVADLSSLTSQLEAALKESKGEDMEDLAMTEEEKQRIVDEADDGW